MYDHTFYKQVQIRRSDTRPHIKWAVSLVILHMITSIFLRALCGYIWVNILTLSPRGGVTKGCYERIHEIGRIRHNLTKDAAATLINSQVTSKLDSFNAVLTGLSTPLLNKLQKVQNSAARLLNGTKKYDHITPVLKKLHWLPVKSRIDYKILLLHKPSSCCSSQITFLLYFTNHLLAVLHKLEGQVQIYAATQKKTLVRILVKMRITMTIVQIWM